MKHLRLSKKILISFICIAAFFAIIIASLSVFYYYSGRINDLKFITEPPVFSATVTIDNDNIEINSWHNRKDNKEYLFLPSGADISSLTLHCDNADSLNINDEGTYKVEIGGKKYDTVILKCSDIPSIHITTESGSLDLLCADKNYKEGADIKIFSDSSLVKSDTLKYIKGRGNKSWEKPQKSFNIKFAKKTNLFDMGDA